MFETQWNKSSTEVICPMTDIVSPETRSRMMSGIRGKGTRPEMRLRRYLHSQGLRYRVNVRGLPGTPDLVFPMYRTIVFVHGCYWHRHTGCRQAYAPRSNIEFWSKKFRANVERDKQAVDRLIFDGWRVIIIWECGLKSSEAERELAWLPLEIRSGNQTFLEWPFGELQ